MEFDEENNAILQDVENDLESETADALGVDSFKDTSVFPLDLMVDALSYMFGKEQFDFSPDFQRRKVWDVTRKSKFLESMILGLPVPSLLVAKDDSRNKYIIIDGKQRLSAIRDFVCPEDGGKGYRLKGLEVVKELEGYTFDELQKDPTKTIFLSRFTSYPLKTNVVRNYDEKKLYFIFARLNSGSVPLSTQELRHTLFPGDFSKFINKESKENLAIKRLLRLGKEKVDPRMRDAELLCRHFAFKYFLDKYDGTVGALLDYCYKEINSKWAEYKAKVQEDLTEFNESIDLIYKIFGDNAFKKYSYDGGSGQYLNFNRLVYDVLSVLFSNPENRVRVAGKEKEFEEFFKGLFADDIYANCYIPTTSETAKTKNRFKYLETRFDEVFSK